MRPQKGLSLPLLRFPPDYSLSEIPSHIHFLNPCLCPSICFQENLNLEMLPRQDPGNSGCWVTQLRKKDWGRVCQDNLPDMPGLSEKGKQSRPCCRTRSMWLCSGDPGMTLPSQSLWSENSQPMLLSRVGLSSQGCSPIQAFTKTVKHTKPFAERFLPPDLGHV